MPRFRFEERLDWRTWVTPKPLVSKPIHRWYIFPHSFTSELVHALIAEWGLTPADNIIDPFCGAGTTILAAKEHKIPATGYDISPLAVMATRVKTANYSLKRLTAARDRLETVIDPTKWNGASKPYPELVEKALPGRLLGGFDAVASEIDRSACDRRERDFFHLALLSVLPRYSRAIATGGWLKWVKTGGTIRSLPASLKKQIQLMIEDLDVSTPSRPTPLRVARADCRSLPDMPGSYSAVITSPPYPNRHDYTRVFGVELMFGFTDWEETRRLRYQSFHSHPEARPSRPERSDYRPPAQLSRLLTRLRRRDADPRVVEMLQGYFLDMYLSLSEVRRVCRKGAHIAFIVGNAQYYGESVLVDEITAEVGESAGLIVDRLLIARYRGNSAQQMKQYGRQPSRETVVLFTRP